MILVIVEAPTVVILVLVGVFIMTALLFGVHIGACDFWKLPHPKP